MNATETKPIPDWLEYANAMVEARKERDDLMAQISREAMNDHEWLEQLAKSLGIQTGRESWWDSNETYKKNRVLERIKRLRGK